MKINIRKATEDDMQQVLGLIRELAVYEKAPEEVQVSEEMLKRDGFSDRPLFHIYLAEDNAGNLLGMAFYYIGYSTWKGKMLYLDDLVVKKEYRRKGIGRMLLDKLMEVACEEDIKQLRWHVLDWNEPAISFYEKLGVELDPEWITCRVNEELIHSYSSKKEVNGSI